MIKIFVGGGGGGRGGEWDRENNSEICLKWGGGVIKESLLRTT